MDICQAGFSPVVPNVSSFTHLFTSGEQYVSRVQTGIGNREQYTNSRPCLFSNRIPNPAKNASLTGQGKRQNRQGGRCGIKEEQGGRVVASSPGPNCSKCLCRKDLQLLLLELGSFRVFGMVGAEVEKGSRGEVVKELGSFRIIGAWCANPNAEIRNLRCQARNVMRWWGGHWFGLLLLFSVRHCP